MKKLSLIILYILFLLGALVFINAPIQGIKDLRFFAENQNVVVYFGRPDCISCVKFEKELKSYIRDIRNYQPNFKVYYFNTAYWRGKDEGVLERYGIQTVPQLMYLDGKEQDKLPEYVLCNPEEDSLKTLDFLKSCMNSSSFYKNELNLFLFVLASSLILLTLFLKGRHISEYDIPLLLLQLVLGYGTFYTYFRPENFRSETDAVPAEFIHLLLGEAVLCGVSLIYFTFVFVKKNLEK